MPRKHCWILTIPFLPLILHRSDLHKYLWEHGKYCGVYYGSARSYENERGEGQGDAGAKAETKPGMITGVTKTVGTRKKERAWKQHSFSIAHSGSWPLCSCFRKGCEGVFPAWVFTQEMGGSFLPSSKHSYTEIRKKARAEALIHIEGNYS